MPTAPEARREAPAHDPAAAAAGAIDIPAPPRLEIGSLAWVRTARVEAEDLLVTAAFRFLSAPGTLSNDKAREIGRALGREARPGQVPEFLRAFSHLGLGGIELREQSNGRHVFVGRDILVDSSNTPPACSMALGFVEGVVGASTGHTALGAEITCRGRGQSECRFLVMERR